MAYEDYHVNADDIKLDGDPNIRRTVPPSPSGGGGGISYGTCTTAAATAAKVVTLSDASGWELKQGASVAVKFSNTNTFSATAQDPVTLNVNNTGAKNIYYGGSANPTGTNTTAFGRANYVNTYVYDGTYWVWTGSSADNNTTYSAMSKSELTTGTATTSRVVRADYLKQGIEEIIEDKDTNFEGTRSEWNALSTTEKAKYLTMDFTDDGGLGDISDEDVTFTSSDVVDANANSWTVVSPIASGTTLNTLFSRVSQMFKNIRYLYNRDNAVANKEQKIGTFFGKDLFRRYIDIGDGSSYGLSLNSTLQNIEVNLNTLYGFTSNYEVTSVETAFYRTDGGVTYAKHAYFTENARFMSYYNKNSQKVYVQCGPQYNAERNRGVQKIIIQIEYTKESIW